MADELLLTESEYKKVLTDMELPEVCAVYDEDTIATLEAQLAKVIDKRLDRPELREKIRLLLANAEMNCTGGGDYNLCRPVLENEEGLTGQLLALIPDIEEAKKQEDNLSHWDKLLPRETE